MQDPVPQVSTSEKPSDGDKSEIARFVADLIPNAPPGSISFSDCYITEGRRTVSLMTYWSPWKGISLLSVVSVYAPAGEYRSAPRLIHYHVRVEDSGEVGVGRFPDGQPWEIGVDKHSDEPIDRDEVRWLRDLLYEMQPR